MKEQFSKMSLKDMTDKQINAELTIIYNGIKDYIKPDTN